MHHLFAVFRDEALDDFVATHHIGEGSGASWPEHAKSPFPEAAALPA
eukprot:gene27967-34251_t